jgi:hypothetical protein
MAGITIAARTARSAAGVDHETRHQRLPCGPGPVTAAAPGTLEDWATALDM